MRFEDRVTVLCSQALTAMDEMEVRRILADLRFMLHQHIEHLRSGLLVAYTRSVIRSKSAQGLLQSGPNGTETIKNSRNATEHSSRTWQQVVHELAREKSHERALQLTRELSFLLQDRQQTADERSGCGNA